MGRKYKEPPIVEALCEFQFIPIQPWEMTIPGLLYEKIKGEFPERQQQLGMSVGFQPKESGIEQKIEMLQRMQFLRPNKTALIQVGPDLLTINQLKPYPTWSAFKPIIIDTLKKYQVVSNPKGFRKIGLRYINVIEFDQTTIEITDYFHYYPFIPNTLPQLHDSFLTRVEFPFEDGNERLILTLGTVIPSKPNMPAISLDLDYVMATPEYVSLKDVSEWVEKSHERVENAFEASITDKARNIFQEKK